MSDDVIFKDIEKEIVNKFGVHTVDEEGYETLSDPNEPNNTFR